MNALRYEDGTELQTAVMLDPSQKSYNHFLAVANGEREDRNMPESWPVMLRLTAEKTLARSGVAAEKWSAEIRNGKVWLVASGRVNKNSPEYQQAVEYERKIEELRRAMA